MTSSRFRCDRSSAQPHPPFPHPHSLQLHYPPSSLVLVRLSTLCYPFQTTFKTHTRLFYSSATNHEDYRLLVPDRPRVACDRSELDARRPDRLALGPLPRRRTSLPRSWICSQLAVDELVRPARSRDPKVAAARWRRVRLGTKLVRQQEVQRARSVQASLFFLSLLLG